MAAVLPVTWSGLGLGLGLGLGFGFGFGFGLVRDRVVPREPDSHGKACAFGECCRL